MPRLQRSHIGGDPKQLADKILNMWRQIDHQFRKLFSRAQFAACIYQAVKQAYVNGF